MEDKNNIIKFTPTEWEMITDRPMDCIAECITDDPDWNTGNWTKDEIIDAAREIFGNKLRTVDMSDPLTKAIIADAILGGTFLERLEDVIYHYGYHDPRIGGSSDITRSKMATIRKSAKSIEKKTGFEFYY